MCFLCSIQIHFRFLSFGSETQPMKILSSTWRATKWATQLWAPQLTGAVIRRRTGERWPKRSYSRTLSTGDTELKIMGRTEANMMSMFSSVLWHKQCSLMNAEEDLHWLSEAKAHHSYISPSPIFYLLCVLASNYQIWHLIGEKVK